MKKKLRIRFCPRCHSRDINLHKFPAMAFFPSRYVCENCGYGGHLFPDIAAANAKKLKPKQKSGGR